MALQHEDCTSAVRKYVQLSSFRLFLVLTCSYYETAELNSVGLHLPSPATGWAGAECTTATPIAG